MQAALDLNATDDAGGQVVVTGANNLIRRHNAGPLISVSSDDPLLGTLANNGGPTLTHALLTNSPAIDLGSNSLSLANDQRGTTYARVVGTADIGAFEVQTVATPELMGDYNGNHAVDAADYVFWRKTMGADVPQYSGADGNGSSHIDDADYGVWRGNFGAPASASSATASPQTNLIVSQSNLISDAAQPEVPGAKRDDLPLAATIGSQNDSPSAQSNTPIHNRLRQTQTTSPVSRQARDEALLSIIAGPREPRFSNGKPKSLNCEFEPQAARPDSSDMALALDDILRISKLTVYREPPGMSRRG